MREGLKLWGIWCNIKRLYRYQKIAFTYFGFKVIFEHKKSNFIVLGYFATFCILMKSTIKRILILLNILYHTNTHTILLFLLDVKCGSKSKTILY